MTQNMWNTDQLNANGEVLIGNGSSSPTATTITAGTNCSVTNGANSIALGYTASATGDWVLLDSATASSTSSIEFTGLSSTYFTYILIVTGYIPAVDGDNLKYRTSTNNGVSYDSGSSDYIFRGSSVNSSGSENFGNGSGNSGSILGSNANPPGTATNETGCAFISLYNPSSSNVTRILSYNVPINTSTDVGLNMTKNTTAIFLPNTSRIGRMSSNGPRRFYTWI